MAIHTRNIQATSRKGAWGEMHEMLQGVGLADVLPPALDPFWTHAM